METDLSPRWFLIIGVSLMLLCFALSAAIFWGFEGSLISEGNTILPTVLFLALPVSFVLNIALAFGFSAVRDRYQFKISPSLSKKYKVPRLSLEDILLLLKVRDTAEHKDVLTFTFLQSRFFYPYQSHDLHSFLSNYGVNKGTVSTEDDGLTYWLTSDYEKLKDGEDPALGLVHFTAAVGKGRHFYADEYTFTITRGELKSLLDSLPSKSQSVSK